MKRYRKITTCIIIIGLLLAFPTSALAQDSDPIPNPGEWVEDLSQQIQFAVDGLWYGVLLLHAQAQWFMMRIFLVTGIVIDLVTDFLAQQVFAPLISQSNSQFGVAVSLSFTIAMLVLGLSYLIAHFIRFHVVEFKSAMMWYVLAALFFQLGPELYLSMNRLRLEINSFFYASALQSVNGGDSPLAPLSQQLSSSDQPMLAPCDNFGWLSGQTGSQVGSGVDGLDIGMAYLLATSRDVLGQAPSVLGNCTTVNPGGYPDTLPFRWYHSGGYFDQTLSPPTWEFISPEQQDQSLALAAAGQYRLIGVWPLLWLGLFEKLVYLLVSFAQGLSFVSFGVAAIFAFFKRTEAIARSVVELWIEIIVSSVVIALGQSLIVSLALAAAATQSPLASIGVGLLCAVMMLILLISAMKLVWNAATRIFGAISQATGGALMTPQQVMTGAAIGTVGAAAAVATGGGALALAGAAMSGMSAAGVGGPAMGMAGSQMMLAGRSLNGAARRGETRASSPAVESEMPTGEAPSHLDPLLLTSGPSKGAIAASTTTLPAFEVGELQANSPLGQRTARIQARFTPLADEEVSPDRLNGATGALSRPSNAMTTVVSASATQAGLRVEAQTRPRQEDDPDGSALRSALQSDTAQDEATAQARWEADHGRDDAALRETLQRSGGEQNMKVDTAGLDRAGRDLSAAAGALKAGADQQHLDRVMGQMEVSGARQVGAVVADAVDLEREDRQKMNKPMLDGVGDLFGGRMAQAVGLHPMNGQPPISDPARFNAVGDQALRLGLHGGQLMQVLKEQSSAEDGRSISPETHDKLVQQVRLTTGARQSAAQQQVGQFLTVAAALPEELRIHGSIHPQRLNRSEDTNGHH